MSYYNTTELNNEELKNNWIKTAKQDELILLIFLKNRKVIFTPHEIQKMLRDDYEKLYPITSVRRAINTLTKIEALEKTKYKRKGPYGASNYCWQYKN